MAVQDHVMVAKILLDRVSRLANMPTNTPERLQFSSLLGEFLRMR